MLFTSGYFLYGFLPLFLGLYYLAQERYRPWVIAGFSYFFYGWWRPDFVLLMWLSTVVDYNCGRGITRARSRGLAGTADTQGNAGDAESSEPRVGRRWLVLSCVVNLGLLAYFKYANFGIEAFNAILAQAGREPLAWAEVLLPVGISFYTFQTLSYTIDVYRGDAQPVGRFRDFACYVSMFPQLVAGPIVRYQSVAEQLRARTHSLETFSLGVLFFQAGMAKKVLLADTLAGTADGAFAAETLSTLGAWVGALAYTFQIYFDFSGYSDMAIGLGLMIGFRFPINFDRPYTARSITEFWQRWHISLSTFLRDYLYVPLGGNRKGPVRTYINLCLTMLLGGLWHGAAWTFVAWGAYQGAWLVLERLGGRRTLYGFLPGPLQVLPTLVIIVVGWVLFRSESLPQALSYLGTMFGLGSGTPQALTAEPVAQSAILAFGVGSLILWALPTTQSLAKRRSLIWSVTLQLLFLAALITLHDAANVPFLYFQF